MNKKLKHDFFHLNANLNRDWYEKGNVGKSVESLQAESKNLQKIRK